MKKSIIKITTAIVFTVMSFTCMAQNADRKPVLAEVDQNTTQDKTATPVTAPQIVTATKAMTLKEQPKPIVPGGEFKPLDTSIPVKNYAKTQGPEKALTPMQPLQQKQQ